MLGGVGFRGFWPGCILFKISWGVPFLFLSFRSGGLFVFLSYLSLLATPLWSLRGPFGLECSLALGFLGLFFGFLGLGGLGVLWTCSWTGFGL